MNKERNSEQERNTVWADQPDTELVVPKINQGQLRYHVRPATGSAKAVDEELDAVDAKKRLVERQKSMLSPEMLNPAFLYQRVTIEPIPKASVPVPDIAVKSESAEPLAAEVAAPKRSVLMNLFILSTFLFIAASIVVVILSLFGQTGALVAAGGMFALTYMLFSFLFC